MVKTFNDWLYAKYKTLKNPKHKNAYDWINSFSGEKLTNYWLEYDKENDE